MDNAPHRAPTALQRQRRHWLQRSAAWALATLAGTAGAQDDYVAQYGLRPGSTELDLGIQPMGVPAGVVSAVMRRDRLLQAALAERKTPLRSWPFRRGADMRPLLADQRLDAAMLGDMSTLLAAASGDVWIVGLTQQAAIALVARSGMVVGQLAGKRIGVVEASSAHLTVLQGLQAAGLSQQQVQWVFMGVADMPQALEDGQLDAFAAREPFTTIALNKNPRHRIVFRGASSDYFVLARAFARQQPQAALELIAAFVRALEWMRESQVHLEQAARWSMAESAAFSGVAPALTSAQVRAITRRELLDIPSAPTLLDSGGPPRLKAEFEFLRRLGKLPATAAWAQVEAALAYDGLASVQSDERRWRLHTYDYQT